MQYFKKKPNFWRLCSSGVMTGILTAQLCDWPQLLTVVCCWSFLFKAVLMCWSLPQKRKFWSMLENWNDAMLS